MSEYQYYEFQAIDRALSKRQLGELRSISTRADITATSFVNVYNWGDLKADPRRMMEKYFDAFVYVANWGSRRFMLRLPGRLFDLSLAAKYGTKESLEIWRKGEHVLLSFDSDDEADEDWYSGEGWLASLIYLRSDLLAGDLRSLYLGWLAGIQFGWNVGKNAKEPPVPPGLSNLNGPLEALAGFLRIDADLIRVAAEHDKGKAPSGSSQKDLKAWINSLPIRQKNDLLLHLAEDEGPHARMEILRRFREAHAEANRAEASGEGIRRRTAAQLLAAAKARDEQRRRREAERIAKEETRLAKKEAAARAKFLDDLAGQEERTWNRVDTLIDTTSQMEYDRAVRLLIDLRDLADRQERSHEFHTRIQELRQQHRRKSSMMRRLAEAGL